MKPTTYNKHAAFVDNYGVVYLFGRGGFIDVIDDLAVAHIQKDCFRLRTSDFADLRYLGEAQEVEVSLAGFKGMIEHLGVSSTHANQRRLKSFSDHKNRQKLPNEIKEL